MSPAIVFIAAPRTGPGRASVRMLCRRLRVMHWLLGVLAVAVFLGLALVAQRGIGPASGVGLMWLIVGGLGLWQYGMVLALATAESARGSLDLVPGARAALWRATATLGTLVAASVAVGGVLLSGLGGTPVPLPTVFASASMALASGFGLVFVSRVPSNRRWWFLALALLPLTLWRPLVPGEQAALPASPVWLLLWGLAWPTCVAILARELTARASAAHGGESLRTTWRALNERLRWRGFDCTRADPRWLLRDTAQRVDLNGLLGWLAALVFIFAVNRDLASTLMTLAFVSTFAAAPGLFWMTEGGLRPRLLLLPGGHFRHRLGWTVFREGLRAWVGTALLALALWAAAAGLGHPGALKSAGIGAAFAGLVVLTFGGTIATRGWIAHTGWRVATQMTAGLGLLLLCVLGAVALERVAGDDQRIWFVAALAAGATQAALGVALVAASARAWTTLDLAQLTRPERQRGPFDPPLPRTR